MGHSMNKILKDIINRYHLLQGKQVVYKPGWDTHGLPIEVKSTSSMSHKEMNPLTVRAKSKELATREIEQQIEGFRLFGIMADWSNVYKTFDPDYEYHQLQVFGQMVRKGLVYRAHRPVFYSPRLRTALAEAELEYNDNHMIRSAYVKYPLTEPGEDLLSKIPDSDVRTAVSRGELQVVVWTTTPWTLPSNMAVAINPELSYSLVRQQTHGLLLVATERVSYLAERKLGLALYGSAKTRPDVGPLKILATMSGSDLLSSRYRHPFLPQGEAARPILPAEYVTNDSGTGLVHTAPAHGLDDYRLCIAHGVISSSTADTSTHLLCPLDLDGRFTSEIRNRRPEMEFLVGQSALHSGTYAIIRHLADDGSLLLEQPIQHRYPHDWRTKTPVMMLANSQWFVDVSSLKGKARDALASVKFIGSQNDRLARVVESRTEWCISRQRAWGLPIPVLFDRASGDPLLTHENIEYIANVLRQKGTDHWWIGDAEEFVAPQYKDGNWVKGTDTLDVWFDSGTSWLGAQSRPGQPVADLYLEGTDQHRGWFQSSLLTKLASGSMEESREAPFKAVATHGYVLDRRGNKMSKSLGNFVSPFFFIAGGPKKNDPAWGTDVVRLWVARSAAWGQDVRVSPLIIKHSSKVLFQIRNTARFLLANLPATKADTPSLSDIGIVDGLTLIDRHVLNQLVQVDEECRSCYEELDFPGVVRRLAEFSSSTLSSLYFSVIKDTLYSDSPISSPRRRAALACCDQILDTLTSVVAPLAPYLAEEIWHYRDGAVEDPPAQSDEEEPSFFHEGWRPIARAEEWRKDDIVKVRASKLLKVREHLFSLIERARQAKIRKQSVEFDLDILLPANTESSLGVALRQHQEELASLFTVAHVRLLPLSVDADRAKAGGHEYGANTLSETIGTGGDAFTLILRPSKGKRCPRCWICTSDKESTVCARCNDVLVEMDRV